MKSLIIVYYYDEEYNVFITIDFFFLTIDVMMAKGTINSLDQDTQGLLGMNTFLNLFNH